MHQTILAFSERYLQTILQTFPDFISLSNNIDIFRELLANNMRHFSSVYIKQYWHFQSVHSIAHLNYSKIFVQSSFDMILTLSESNYQTILTYSKLISNSIHTFAKLLSNNSKHFFESLNGHLNRSENSQAKVRKVSIYTLETYNFAMKYSCVYMIGHLWFYGRKRPSPPLPKKGN